MKEDKDILEEAIDALKNEQIPPGPSQELVDATVTKLAEISEQSGAVSFWDRIRTTRRLAGARTIAKFAAAAVLMMVAGYIAGRFSAPQGPNMEQLQAALEPAIREKVVAQMKDYLQLGLANGYVQLREELDRQRRQDMGLFAEQTLAVYNTVTNERLTKLIESIDAAQAEDRQWVTAALGQVELNRRRDNARLSNALATFAVRTEDELQRTKQGVVQLLSYGPQDEPVMHESENPDNSDEGRNQ